MKTTFICALIGQNQIYSQPQFSVWNGLEQLSNYRLALNHVKNENYLIFYVNFALIGENQFFLNLILYNRYGLKPVSN